MRFNPSEYAIRQPVLTVYFLTLLLIAGIYAYQSLGQNEDPPFNFRIMSVRVFWPGADAMQMVEQVGDRLEATLQEVPYADKIRSYAKPGELTVLFELRDSAPPEEIPDVWYTARKKLNDMWHRMPDGVQGPYVNDEFGDVFGIIYAVRADGYSWAEQDDFAEEIRQQLLRVPDVAKVEFFGRQSRQIYVEISQNRMASLGIDMQQVVEEINRQNAVRFAGTLNGPEDKINIRVSGQFNAVQDLQTLPLRFADRTFRLGDIAEVYEGYTFPPDPKVRFNGEDVIAIGISMSEGGDIIRLGENLRSTISRIQQSLPIGIELENFQNQPKLVADSVGEFIKTLIEALVIVLAVSFVILGVQGSFRHIDWRPGLVVALAIPTVLAGTFLVMAGGDVDLHKISLGALIISLGLLVDDAIIIIEMTVRKLEEGEPRLHAATHAYRETAFPMLTGTLITATGFLPIGLARSPVGEYTFSIFAVTASTLLISWLVAVYFVPFLAYHLLREKVVEGDAPHDVYDTPVYRRVRHWVRKAVEHRWRTIGATLLALVLGILGMQVVEKQFFPDSNRPELLVDLWLPEGTSFENTYGIVERVENRFLGEPDLGKVTSFVGTGAPRFYLPMNIVFPQDNVAQLVVEPGDPENRGRLQARLREILASDFPEARFRVRLLPNGPPVAYPIRFRVIGPEAQTARELANRVRAIMAQDPDIVGLNDDWHEPIKALHLQLDQSRARALGVTSASVATAGQTLLSGMTIGQYREQDETIDIVLRQPEAERRTLSAVGNAYMPLPHGESVPISQVADSRFAWEHGVIWRYNRDFAVTVQADARPGVQGDTVARRIDERLDAVREDLPFGYHIEIGGIVERSREGQASIALWLPVMLAIMLTLLMLQLRSLSRAVLVLITGPLGIIGAVFTLFLLGRPLGFVAFLGIIAMNGMIIRNAVILLDQIEQDIANGVPAFDAVVDSAVRRARPIMLTTVTAVLAMIPLTNTSFWGPMAVAIMGGLLVATALTLLSLPAMYSAWFRIRPTPE